MSDWRDEYRQLIADCRRQFVNDVIHGRRKPTDRILKAVGLKRVEVYVSR